MFSQFPVVHGKSFCASQFSEKLFCEFKWLEKLFLESQWLEKLVGESQRSEKLIVVVRAGSAVAAFVTPTESCQGKQVSQIPVSGKMVP